jgi:hypothetical protein
MAAFGRTEAYVQGWDIAPEQLQICRSSLDGSEILLGSGQFGKVLHLSVDHALRCDLHPQLI